MQADGSEIRYTYDHFGVVVQDLNSAIEELRVKVEDPAGAPNRRTGTHVAFIEGPDHTRIEVLQRDVPVGADWRRKNGYRVEPCLRWQTPGRQPNGMQATTEGLWVIDQIDPNVIYLLDYTDGRELRQIPTRALHSSGITIDPSGNIWVASTFTYELICFDRETGKELVAYRTPPHDTSGGPHGTEWRDGKLWFNVPVTGASGRWTLRAARSCTRFHFVVIVPTASPGTRTTPHSGVSTATAA